MTLAQIVTNSAEAVTNDQSLSILELAKAGGIRNPWLLSPFWLIRVGVFMLLLGLWQNFFLRN